MDFWVSEISYKAEARAITGEEIIPDGISDDVESFGDISDDYADPARWGYLEEKDLLPAGDGLDTSADAGLPMLAEETYEYATGQEYGGENDEGTAPFGGTADGEEANPEIDAEINPEIVEGEEPTEGEEATEPVEPSEEEPKKANWYTKE